MAIWIQSLSWALIYGLGQGFLVYASLWLILKLSPSVPASVRYHLSLSGLTILLGWFAATWWQQFHSLSLLHELLLASQVPVTTVMLQSMPADASLHVPLSSLRVIFPWLSGCYVAGLALMLLRLSAGMLQLSALRKQDTAQPGALLSELLAHARERMHLDAPVRLLISARAQVPMVIGCLKPVILLPAATIAGLSTAQLETILLHELAHIKRYDYLVNILQTAVETILFFNPFVWLISSITRQEREHCCDDMVLQYTDEPLSYATALASLASQPGSHSRMAIAATGQTTHLFNRIQRIMEMKKNPFSYSSVLATIFIVVAFTGSVIWLTPSFAGSKKEKAHEVKASTAAASSHPTAAQTTPPPLKTKKEKPQQTATVAATAGTAQPETANTMQPDESQLVNSLMADGLVDQVRGFVVEKIQDKLFINGKQQTEDVAGKYLQAIRKETIRVQVYPFTERLRQHPDGSFIQILFPIQFSSGCVDYGSKKEGC